MAEIENINRIEAFLEGRLPPEAQQAFEAELESNPVLAADLKRYQMARQAIEVLSEEALRKKIRGWQREPVEATTEQPARRPFLRSVYVRWAVAASVPLLLVAAWLLLFNAPPTTEQLALDYLERPQIDQFKSGRQQEAETAIAEFESGNFSAARENLEQDSTRTDLQTFLLAHSAFQEADYSAAEGYFAELLKMEDTSYYEEAQWGMLLSRLAQDEIDADFSKQLDAIINDSGHSFNEEAQALRAALESVE